MFDYEDYLNDAYQIVSGWEVASEDFPACVNQQARLMAGEPWDLFPEQSYPDDHALKF